MPIAQVLEVFGRGAGQAGWVWEVWRLLDLVAEGARSSSWRFEVVDGSSDGMHRWLDRVQ